MLRARKALSGQTPEKQKPCGEHPAEKLLSGQAKPVRQRIRRRRLLRPRENRKQRPLSLRENRRQKLLRPSAKQNRKQLCPQTEPGRRLLQLQQKRKQKQLCPQTEPGRKGPCLQAKHKKKRRPAEPLRKNPFGQEKLYALLNVLVPDRTVSETEKRALASFPEVSSDRIVSGAFSEDFETWASDQLVGRNALIRIRSTFGLLTGNRLSRDVFKSGDGYLIERMTEVDQNRLDQMLNAVNSFCARTEIPGTFVCAPNAVSICSDLLPASAITEDQGTWMQYIGSRLDGPEFCDLTGPLAEYYANGGQAYYRSDHHWTTEAAFYTLPTVRAALGLDPESAPSMTPLAVCNDFVGSLAAKSGFSVSKKDTIFIYRRDAEPAYIVTDPSAQTKRATVYSMEGLKSSDPYTVFLGGNTGHLNIQTDNAEGEKLLVFKDSYFNCFLPFLLSDYREIDIIDPRYYYENLDELLLMGGYDRVLFFYDLNTLAEDTSLALVLGTEQG